MLLLWLIQSYYPLVGVGINFMLSLVYTAPGFIIQSAEMIVGLLVVLCLLVLLAMAVIIRVMAERGGGRVIWIMTRFIYPVHRLFYPVFLYIDRIANILGRTLSLGGNKYPNKAMASYPERVKDSSTQVAVDDKILSRGIIKFGQINAREIMKSRMDIVAVEAATPFDKLLKIVVECGYSRLPVYRDSFDTITGILYIKDLLPFIYEKNDFEWAKLIRPCIFVPQGKKIKELLKEFQERKILMAVVVDEYGGTSGIITLEDILEEIVGEIYDESDEEETTYSIIDEKNYIFEGRTQIKDFCNITGINYSCFDKIKGEADTLAGLILEVKQELPDREEIFKFENFVLVVESVDNRRIKKVRVKLHNEVKLGGH